MKKWIATFVLLLRLQLHAEAPMVFTDHDLGITMEIPHKLSQNWTIPNSPSGARVEVFISEDWEGECYVLIVGRAPLQEMEGDCEFSESFFASRLEAQFEEMEFFGDGVTSAMRPLFHDFDLSLPITSYRLLFKQSQEASGAPLDLHWLCRDQQIFFLVVGLLSSSDEEELTAFSGALLKTIHMIE